MAQMQPGEPLSTYTARLANVAASLPEVQARLKEVQAQLDYALACHGQLERLTLMAQSAAHPKEGERRTIGAGMPSVPTLIVAALRKHGPLGVKDLGQLLDVKASTLSAALTTLKKREEVRAAEGKWALVNPPEPEENPETPSPRAVLEQDILRVLSEFPGEMSEVRLMGQMTDPPKLSGLRNLLQSMKQQGRVVGGEGKWKVAG
jgi:hypothetical protein